MSAEAQKTDPVDVKSVDPQAELKNAYALIQANYQATEEAFRKDLEALLTKYGRKIVVQQVVNFVPAQG